MTTKVSRAWWRESHWLVWLPVGLIGVMTWLGWSIASPILHGLVRVTDRFAFGLYNTVANPLNGLRSSTSLPLLVPLLLGLMASVAPCQLSTGTATLAYVAQDGQENGALRRGLAFVAARVLFYAVVGVVVLYLLGGSVDAPGTFFAFIRKVLGPLTVLIGLVTLGLVRFRFGFGSRASSHFSSLAQTRGGIVGAFLLGLAFSFAFCPTLFLLFFGLTVPLALTAPLGFAYPVLFALGMSLPLLTFAWLIGSVGAGANSSQGFLRGLRAFRRVAHPLSGVVFVLAGLYDTLRYWLV